MSPEPGSLLAPATGPSSCPGPGHIRITDNYNIEMKFCNIITIVSVYLYKLKRVKARQGVGRNLHLVVDEDIDGRDRLDDVAVAENSLDRSLSAGVQDRVLHN